MKSKNEEALCIEVNWSKETDEFKVDFVNLKWILDFSTQRNAKGNIWTRLDSKPTTYVEQEAQF